MRIPLFVLMILSMSCVYEDATAGAIEGSRWNRSGLTKYGKQAWRENRLFPVAEGFANPGGLERVSVTFGSHRKVEVSEARKLIVEEVLKLTSLLEQGQTKSILKTNGPFGLDHLYYMLSFHKPDGGYYEPPKVTLAMYFPGYIIYEGMNGICYDKLHEETFEEALRIVEEESRLSALSSKIASRVVCE